MKQAVAYVRVSSKEQHTDGFSIPAQRKLLEDYSREHGYKIVQVFEDVETAKRAGRQSFEKMLAFLRNSTNCETILVEKTDRLYRNIRDWVTLDEAKVEIHFVKENVILNDEARSSEKFMHGIKVLMAKNYVDNLSEETVKGMLQKARQGLYPSYAPLGYLNDKESASIIPDPERAPLIRRLYEAYATGRESYDSIVKLGYNIGLRSRKGHRIRKSAVALLLSRITYTGSFVWKGVTYQGTYDPIISKALFDEVQKRRSGVTHSNPKRHNHAFRGLVRCGNCGCMVSGQTKQGKYIYYCCTHGRNNCQERPVNQRLLAEMLGAPLKSLRLSQERLDWIIARLKSDNTEESQQRTSMLKRLHRDELDLLAKLDMVYEDKLSGTITSDFWKRKNSEYSARLDWIKSEIRENEQNSGDKLASVERILELSQAAYSLYLSQDPHEQRKLLDILLQNSTLQGLKAQGELRHPFDLIADGAIEDQSKIRLGVPIFEQNANWVPGWDGNRENVLINGNLMILAEHRF